MGYFEYKTHIYLSVHEEKSESVKCLPERGRDGGLFLSNQQTAEKERKLLVSSCDMVTIGETNWPVHFLTFSWKSDEAQRPWFG